MATYKELYDLTANSELKNLVTVACTVAAYAVNGEDAATPNHANRLIWAARVFADPAAEAQRMYPMILAANAGATVAQITGAADADILVSVQGVINLFATGA